MDGIIGRRNVAGPGCIFAGQPFGDLSPECSLHVPANEGRPGDRISGRAMRVVIHPAGLPIQQLRIKVLRRPVESAQIAPMALAETLVCEMGRRRRDRCLDGSAVNPGVFPSPPLPP